MQNFEVADAGGGNSYLLSDRHYVLASRVRPCTNVVRGKWILLSELGASKICSCHRRATEVNVADPGRVFRTVLQDT